MKKRKDGPGIRNRVWYFKYGTAKEVPCYWCGKSLNFKESTVEHIIPYCFTKQHILEHMDISCEKCNSLWNQVVTYLVKIMGMKFVLDRVKK